MPKLFDIANTSRRGHFIVADNDAHALEIAKAFKLVKNKYHLTEITDLSDCNLKELVDSGKYGVVIKKLSVIAGIEFFALDEENSFFDMSKNGLKNTWFFDREYRNP